MLTHNIDVVKDFAPTITLEFTVTRLTEWRWRVWLGCKLIALAAFVINCGIRIVPVER